MKVFHLLRTKQMTSLDNLMESDDISNRLKNIINQFTPEGIAKTSTNKSPRKQDDFDDTQMAVETPHTNMMNLALLATTSSSSTLRYLRQEKPFRVQSRTQALEKISDKVHLFIKDCMSYPKFSKEASFENLGLLLDEIF